MTDYQLPKNVGLRMMVEDDREQVTQLWQRRIGNIGARKSFLRDVLHRKRGAWGVVATHDGDVVGFGVCRVTDADGAERYFEGHGSEHYHRQPGLLHMAAVDEDWTGQGIGRAMLEARLELLYKAGVGTVMTASWLRDNQPGSARLFEAAGFELIDVVTDFYNDRDDCPDCAPNACTCSVAIYELPISDVEEVVLDA